MGCNCWNGVGIKVFGVSRRAKYKGFMAGNRVFKDAIKLNPFFKNSKMAQTFIMRGQFREKSMDRGYFRKCVRDLIKCIV